MSWNLTFISEKDFTDHVRATIQKYGDKLESFDLRRFSKNNADPIKLIFDKTVYRAAREETICNEIFRQRDKSNNNDICYFHQHIFQYIDKCRVPANGEEGGWDVIYKNQDGINVEDGLFVHNIYADMMYKHSTMNSALARGTFIKMQDQLLNDDDCACFLVEVIAQKSQNTKWEATVDSKKVGHKLIRRVSIDQFYSIVTGQQDAFYQVCMALPGVIQKVVEKEGSSLSPTDTVFDELQAIANETGIENKDLAMAMAINMLGFSTYNGFMSMLSDETMDEIHTVAHLPEYAKEILLQGDSEES